MENYMLIALLLYKYESHTETMNVPQEIHSTNKKFLKNMTCFLRYRQRVGLETSMSRFSLINFASSVKLETSPRL